MPALRKHRLGWLSNPACLVALVLLLCIDSSAQARSSYVSRPYRSNTFRPMPKPAAPAKIKPPPQSKSTYPKQTLPSRAKAGDAPKSAATAAKLKSDLASRAAREQKTAALSRQRTERGTVIAGKGAEKPAPVKDAQRLAATYGGKQEDWVKKSSSAHTDPQGTKHSTHWYENTKTRQRVEQLPKVDKPGEGRITPPAAP